MNASIGQFGQNYKKLKLPELSFGSIVCRKELGEAYYGVVYLADVLPNLLYSPNHPCAAKVRFRIKVRDPTVIIFEQLLWFQAAEVSISNQS